jgi:3-hydroxyacyl-CoA dehydrogenase
MTTIHTDSERYNLVTVIGAGTIGLSWTSLFLAHGLTVRLYDPIEVIYKRLLISIYIRLGLH